MKRFKRTLLCFILAGCGAEENSMQNKASSSTEIVANNIFQIVKPNSKQHIDIKNIILNKNANITNLELLNTIENKNCSNFNLNNETISFALNAGDYCAYQYHIQQGQKTANAFLELYSTEALKPSLTPISEVLDLTKPNQELYFKISARIEVEQGYHLDTTSIQVFGLNDNVGTAIGDAQGISYTAPELKQPGWNRIHYNLVSKDPALASSPKMGIIYISLLDGANPPPSIDEPNYLHQTTYILNQPEPMQLDLSDLTGLEIHDDDGWKIVHLSSNDTNAAVALADPEAENPKTIRFSATKVGAYSINYIVADPLAAATVGHIKINVDVEDSVATWSGERLILVDNENERHEEQYIGTPRYLDIRHVYDVKAIFDQSVSNSIAGFTLDQAKHYCQSHGDIPTSEQFANLLEISQEVKRWPKEQAYFARDTKGTPEDSSDDTYLAYNLTTKQSRPILEQDRLYLSCVNSGKIKLEQLHSEVMVGETLIHLVTVFHEEHANIIIEPKHSNYGLVETKVEKISVSETKISAATTRSGELTISVTSSAPTRSEPLYPEVELSSYITIIPDEASAQITSIEYENATTDVSVEDKDSIIMEVIADGRDSTKMKVSVTDQYQNPVPNQNVTVTYLSEASPEGAEDLTPEAIQSSTCSINNNGDFDNSGCITITPTTPSETTPYTFTISAQRGFTPLPRHVTFQLELNGTPNDIGESHPLRFIDAVCKDGYNSEATGKCLKILELEDSGKKYFFTAPPSVSFYDYARSFGDRELLPKAEDYKNNQVSITALLINNEVSLGSYGGINFDNATYGDIFNGTDNFVVFRAMPLNQYQAKYLPSEAWCGVLNTINFMGINSWQLLNQSEASSLFNEYTNIEPSLDANTIENHILFRKHGWYLRAHDQIAWFKGTEADNREPNQNGSHLSWPVGIVRLSRGLVNSSAGTGGPGEYGHGHTICQAITN